MRFAMQVNSVNAPVLPASGSGPADEPGSRAEEFSRVLQNAFFGVGNQVARATERATQDQGPRTETRTVERTAAERPVERPVERTVERPATETRDETARSENPAARDTAPRDAEARDAGPARPTEKPRADDKPAVRDTAASDTDADAAAESEAAPAETAVPADTSDAETAETALPEEEAPVAVAAPDALLILELLQQVQLPPAVPAEAVAATAVANPVTPIVAEAVAPVLPVQPAVEVATDAAAPLAAVLPGVAVAAETEVQPQLPLQATPVMPQPVVPQVATEAGVSALLAQQQAMSPEDFAAIQQAMKAQADSQLQADVQTIEPVQDLHLQIAQSVASGIGVTKADTKSEKSLLLDMQTVTTVAPKALVDQSALMAMQGDDDSADAALLMQQQAQTPAQQLQAAHHEVKFAAALQMQAGAEIAMLNTASGGNQTSSSQIGAPTASTVTATQSTPAAQATQHANHTLARNLNAYVSAGEQVAVQIKRGASEGLDKISIRLDPGNLGHVDVKLEVTHDGRLMAVIAADKPETLQMLQKDSASLEQSLRDAGLKTDQQSLSFTLRDQNQAREGRDGQDGNGRGRQRGQGTDDFADSGRADPAQLAANNAQRAAAARGGLDIRI
jgi:flagellar hook-length control protein FliK